MLDIWNAIDRTDNDDIAATYESLLCGSRNHLRAFVYQLEEIYAPADYDYEAQIAIANEIVVPEEITSETDWQAFIDAIIDSDTDTDTERCGRRTLVEE